MSQPLLQLARPLALASILLAGCFPAVLPDPGPASGCPPTNPADGTACSPSGTWCFYHPGTLALTATCTEGCSLGDRCEDRLTECLSSGAFQHWDRPGCAEPDAGADASSPPTDSGP